MDKVAESINSMVQKYGDEVVKQVEKRIDETADEILEYIKKNAPRSDSGSKHLADSFVKTKVGNIVYISSETKGKLVHIIELGFRHPGGKHIPGRPFLRPSYDLYSPKMLEDIKRIIANGTT